MKTFDDLEFKEHKLALSAKSVRDNKPDLFKELDMVKECLNAKQAIIKFDNGRELSVIFGSMFYSNGIDTYEQEKAIVNQQQRVIDSQNKFIDTLYKALKDKPKQEVVYKENDGLRLKYEALKQEYLFLQEVSIKANRDLVQAENKIRNMEQGISDIRFKVQNHYEKQGRV
jgi:lipopolysaccharide export LptBFGC system permease protein LptF